MPERDDQRIPSSRADAELADAMHSIEATGEDWRSRERAVETDDETDDGTGDGRHDGTGASSRGGSMAQPKEDDHG